MHTHGDDDDDGWSQIGGPRIDRVYLTILSGAHSRILWLARAVTSHGGICIFIFIPFFFFFFWFYYLFVYHVWLII